MKSSQISIELVLGKPGSSSVDLEFGFFRATFKKATAEKQNIIGLNSILPSVIATHRGPKVEGRKESIYQGEQPPRGVWRGWVVMSELAAGAELLPEQHKCWHAQVAELEPTVPAPACRSRARSCRAAQAGFSLTPHIQEGCASSLTAGNAPHQLVSVVSVLCQEPAQCRCKKPGWGVATGGFCPFPRAPHPWWWCCEMVPRKHRAEPKVQLSWCPVALAQGLHVIKLPAFTALKRAGIFLLAQNDIFLPKLRKRNNEERRSGLPRAVHPFHFSVLSDI